MKLLVVGTTGGIGVEIIRQAIERRHAVTVFVRSPERLRPFNGRIRVTQGNVLNRAELERVIEGHDAVLSAFGPRLPLAKSNANLLERFATVLTSAMADTRARRLVIVSTGFLFKDSIIKRPTCSAACFFQASSRTPLRWRTSCRRAGLIGPSCDHPNSPTRRIQGNIGCERGTYPFWVSRSHAPISRTS